MVEETVVIDSTVTILTNPSSVVSERPGVISEGVMHVDESTFEAKNQVINHR
jgi:hypothetical protein